MTAGSKSNNKIVDGAIPTGVYYQKDWSGGDRSSYKRAYYRRGIYYPSIGSPPVRVRGTHSKPLPSVKDAPHAWSATITSYSRQAGTVHDPNPRAITSTTGWSEVWSNPTWGANDQIVLINRLRSRVQGSDFDLGVFLGTSHQSLGLITETATRLYRAYKLVKRGNFIGAANKLLGETTAQAIKGHRKARLLALQDEYNFLIGVSPSASAIDPSIIKNAKYRQQSIRQAKRRMNVLKYRKLPQDLEASLPNRKIREPKHVVASGWLELQYGWLPLLNDMKSGAEALAESTRPKRMRYTASYRYKPNVEVTFNNWYNGNYKCSAKRSRYEISRRIVAYVEEKNVPTMGDLISPSTIAWELVPWSFVVDWVAPIGSYLSARGFASDLQGNFVTTERKMLEAADFNCSYGFVTYKFPNNYYKKYFFLRSVSNFLPVPYPAVRGFGESFSWKRAANALSLLVQHGK